jgi:secreted trypsin-like serine protease
MFTINRSSHIARVLLLLALFLIVTSVALAQGGKDDGPRIVGGEEARPDAWPWQVALTVRGYDIYNGLLCGGTLIDARWVLTAAHCLSYYAPSDLYVIAGIHDLVDPNPNYVRVRAKAYLPHPDFDYYYAWNDLAMLYLSEPILERPADGDTLPIAYANLVPSDAGSLFDVMGTVTGWGTTDPYSWSYPERLQEVQVPIVHNAECRRIYGGITDGMLCAGFDEGGKDSCYGDSGGPLVVFDESSDRWLQAGIVSFGAGCGLPGWPGVYTRVSTYRDWIQEVIDTGFPVYEFSMPIVMKSVDTTIKLVPNGDFEMGPELWDEFSARGWELIYQKDMLPPSRPPNGGEWAAWLGGAHNEIAELSQVVEVPVDNPFLAFYSWIDSQDYCGYDYAVILADGSEVGSFGLCLDTTNTYWTRQTIDMSEFAGETIVLEFEVQTDGSGTSNLFLDDIGFSVTESQPELVSPPVNWLRPALKSDH